MNYSADLFNEPVKRPISIGLRLGTMLLDHALVCFLVLGPLIILSNIFESKEQLNHPAPIPVYYLIPVFAFYFCKDCIGGRSLAKRILKLQVVNNKDGYPALPFQTLIRNLFILIWPIEVVTVFFDQERRIGDWVAGTRISYYYPLSGNQRTNIGQAIICFVLVSAFLFLLLILFKP